MQLDSLQFVWPWVFICLPLPWLVYRLLPAASEQQEAALKVPYIEDFEIASEQLGRTRKTLPAILFALAWLALLIAAARPQYIGEAIELPVSGRDLMMAIDLSGSMKTRDFIINGKVINRLEATKLVASDFIQRRVGDRIGLILFGEQAYLQSPLTFDRVTVNTFLLEAALGLAGRKTAIGDAIGLTLKRLRADDNTADDSTAKQQVLILLTDGENTAGELTPIKAAELAKRQGLKIYTIGIGSNRRMQAFGMSLSQNYSEIDEASLKKVAEITGGQYFRARNTKELAKIYQILDQLEPAERDTQSYRPTHALFYWPLAVAITLAGLLSLSRRVR